MAGVGHITIFGLADYAKSFGKGTPLNKLITDSIRVSNQWLVGMSGLISSTNYYRMGRLVAPLGICLAIGGVGGSWLIPDLTAGKISLRDYIGYFGLIVLLLGVMLIRETTAAGMARKKKAKEAAAAFEKQVKSGGATDDGVKILDHFLFVEVFTSGVCDEGEAADSGRILTSVVKRVDEAVYDVVNRAAEGTLEAGPRATRNRISPASSRTSVPGKLACHEVSSIRAPRRCSPPCQGRASPRRPCPTCRRPRRGRATA